MTDQGNDRADTPAMDCIPAPRPSFVGRTRELATLRAALQQAEAGQGRVVMLAGEAGIGKTRTAMEFAALARDAGALVLRGGCYDGEWAPPFGPFAEALAAHARQCDADTLREDLGFGAAPIARVVPAVRERLPDLPEPAPLPPDEERFRLLDAVSQFLIATAARSPVVLVLDDLHWADKGTIAMLRHVARFAPQQRILLLGAYRDVELEPQHALTDALGALYRETTCERIALAGLDAAAVAELVADSEAPPEHQDALASRISAVTNGNPFFVREVLRQLLEEEQRAGPAQPQPAAAIPDSVRQVIGRRVRRLGAEAGRLLAAAAGFGGPFHIGIAGQVAGLDEAQALSAIDGALRAQLVRPGEGSERYDFAHALIRETLYGELSPSRQARLHRQIAEAMERAYGEDAAEHAAEIACQYDRSKALPGGERGAVHAVAAAARAERMAAWDDVATFLRMALDFTAPDDARRPRIVAGLGRALALIPEREKVLPTVEEAVRQLESSEGADAATDYVNEMMELLYDAGLLERAVRLAILGLARVGGARDIRWARFAAVEGLSCWLSDPHRALATLNTPERREISRLLTCPQSERPYYALDNLPYVDRADAVARWGPLYLTGEYRASLPRLYASCERWERDGRITRCLFAWSNVARCHGALGEFALARTALDRAASWARRLTVASLGTARFVAAQDHWRMATDEDWDAPMDGLAHGAGAMVRWISAAFDTAIARIHARCGRIERALHRLAKAIEAIEVLPGWSESYVQMVCDAAEALWLSNRTQHVAIIEHNLREKVVAPDFRSPMVDGRLSLARCAALQARYDEAAEWFARARSVLDEQGARPLRAVADYDEALMYARRGAAGDRERSVPLLEAALAQFRAIGMPGWIRRAEHLLREGREWTPAAQAEEQPHSPTSEESGNELRKGRDSRARSEAPGESAANVFRHEGEYWTLAYRGKTARLRDTKGLHYIARLLAEPGRPVHVRDLATVSQESGAPHGAEDAGTEGDLGAILDTRAVTQYRQRLAEARQELDQATAAGDLGQAARARQEIETITHQLTAAYGLGGRPRRAGDPAERVRKAVTNRIRHALDRVQAAHPELGHHLTNALRTGFVCTYQPEHKVAWEL